MSARCSLETEPWWALAITGVGAVGWPGLGHDLGRRGASVLGRLADRPARRRSR